METIHVQFDELTGLMAPVNLSTGPAPNLLTPGQISSGLVPNPVPATPYVPSVNKELEILFQPMFDEYLEPARVKRLVHPAQAVQALVNSAGIAAEPTYMEDHPIAPVDNNPFVNVFAPEPHSEASLSRDISLTESTYNGVVKRRNRTLVEAARTMLIFSKALMFLWAEAVAIACYTQNRSLIHTHHHKTPYELVHNKKPDLIFFRVFGALCYPTNDSEDIGKL
nr:putative ribonuclease H-like domain-containing protein [Tanacetum cinerariifolium]